MAPQNTIDHIGYISSISGKKATVSINSQSACASCHAKGGCSAADMKEKILTVDTRGASYSAGEMVRVLIARRTGLRAVAFGYIYPFILLMLVLVVATLAGVSELKAGLYSLASLIPYYLGIYLLRTQIDSAFTFRLEKTRNHI